MKTPTVLLALLLGTSLSFFAACKEDPDDPNNGPIRLACDHFQTNQTLTDDPDRPVDYLIDCVMEVAADVRVNPGVVIEFTADAGIEVAQNGSFNAAGTSTAPIQMSGTTAGAGFWKGIFFNSPSSANLLQYVTVDGAGSSTFNTNGDIAAVTVWADTEVRFDHLTVRNSGNYGVHAIYTNSDWSISNSRISSSLAAPVICLPPYLTAFDNTNDFTGNARDHILIDLATQAITSSLTWRHSNVPYRITSTFSYFTEVNLEGASVAIEPGTRIEFEDSLGFHVDANSSLRAIGTAAEPIIFTGATPTAGAWSAIYFNATSTTDNQLQHVQIQYAGHTLDYAQGGIIMRVNPTLTLDKVDFSDISGCSTFNKDIATNPNLSSSNLTHTNTAGDFCHE